MLLSRYISILISNVKALTVEEWSRFLTEIGLGEPAVSGYAAALVRHRIT